MRGIRNSARGNLTRRAAMLATICGCIGPPTLWPEPSAAQEKADTPIRQGITNLTAADQLLHATVQIISETTPGNISFGTGFFFVFFPTGNQNIPAIVTNKHVIAGARVGHLKFTGTKEDGLPT